MESSLVAQIIKETDVLINVKEIHFNLKRVICLTTAENNPNKFRKYVVPWKNYMIYWIYRKVIKNIKC